MKIALLVLNYNGLFHLKNFLFSASFLLKISDVDLFIVDNASYDKSIDFISSHFSWVNIIRNSKNFGWAGGYNEAIFNSEDLKNNNYSHFIFLNNDIFIDINWIENIKNIIRLNPDIAEFGCRAIFADKFILESPIQSKNIKNMIYGGFLGKHKHAKSFWHYDRSMFQLQIRTMYRQQEFKLSFLSKLNEYFQGHYVLTLRAKQKQTFVIECSDGFSLFAVTDKKQKNCYYLLKTENSLILKNNNNFYSLKELVISQENPVQIFRLIDKSEKLFNLIQNSGTGLTSGMQGFDLHAYEAENVKQNFSEISGICGVCKIVKSDVFFEMNGFDQNYFMYYEDLDFSIRLKKHGHKIYFLDDVKIRHVHSATSQENSPFFKRQVFWSMLYFQMKHGIFSKKIKIFLKYLILSIVDIFSFSHLKNKYYLLSVIKLYHLRYKKGYKK